MILGFVLVFLAAEMFFGSIHGSDMCWLGDPFVSPPCPKNYTPDPFQMFFSNVWAHMAAGYDYDSWGIRLYMILMVAAFIGSLISFLLALSWHSVKTPSPASEQG